MQELQHPPPTAGASATHLDLMVIARRIRRAAAGDDPDGVLAELRQLATALDAHVADEQPRLEVLPGSAAAIAQDGQRRLRRLVDEVLDEQAGPDACTCIVRAAEIELALRRQAELEEALLRRHLGRAPLVDVARVYDDPAAMRGHRALVDRLWPRGVSKDRAPFDEWCREVAPSTELRRWYGHDPARFDEFSRRYGAELTAAPAADAVTHLLDIAATRPLTLLTATRDLRRSGAEVLRGHLVSLLIERR
ncbi:MAG TPA: DUF488 family protein [Acidimicrobiales bacterium]|nr:DUF488 family protein [Acidimicrobiales bacterium]